MYQGIFSFFAAPADLRACALTCREWRDALLEAPRVAVVLRQPVELRDSAAGWTLRGGAAPAAGIGGGLAPARRLRELRFEDASHVPAGTLEAVLLAHASRLEVLVVPGLDATPGFVAAVCGCTRLRHLDINMVSSLTDASLAAIARIGSLEEVNIIDASTISYTGGARRGR